MIHLVLKQVQNLYQFISLSIAPATIMMGVSFHLSKRYGSRLNGMLIILSGIIILLGMAYASTMIEDLKPSLVDSSVEMVPLVSMGHINSDYNRRCQTFKNSTQKTKKELS